MKLIVFGASGSIGRPLVKQALEQGHELTAFVRNPNNPLKEIKNDRLKVVVGDVFNKEQVAKQVKGQDAVFCVLGAGRKGGVRAPATQVIIEAMKELGVNRFICQSTLGAGDSWDNLNFFWKRIMFGWFLKDAYEDHQLQEEYVKRSGLDWTIVRPGAFTDGPLTGSYRHGFTRNDKAISLKISRADVASFLLRQVNSSEYLKKSPGLSY